MSLVVEKLFLLVLLLGCTLIRSCGLFRLFKSLQITTTHTVVMRWLLCLRGIADRRLWIMLLWKASACKNWALLDLRVRRWGKSFLSFDIRVRVEVRYIVVLLHYWRKTLRIILKYSLVILLSERHLLIWLRLWSKRLIERLLGVNWLAYWVGEYLVLWKRNLSLRVVWFIFFGHFHFFEFFLGEWLLGWINLLLEIHFLLRLLESWLVLFVDCELLMNELLLLVRILRLLH